MVCIPYLFLAFAVGIVVEADVVQVRVMGVLGSFAMLGEMAFSQCYSDSSAASKHSF